MLEKAPRWALAVTLCGFLTGCVPAYQYEPLTLTALDAPGQSRVIALRAEGLWRDTGIEMRKDEVYQVNTQGTWWPGGFCGEVDASGLAAEHLACMKGIFAQSFPIPSAKIGAVVGRIGPDGTPFLVGGTRGFIANNDGNLFLRMNDPDDLSFDNVGEIKVAVQRFGEGLPPPSFDGVQEETGVAATVPQPRIPGTGYYAAEQDITFNVLENVEFDPVTGALTLSGRFDPTYAGPRISYLQHLAEFLDNPGPQASLDWTPEFERRVDAFFRRMDNEQDMANLVGSGQLVDDAGNITRKGKLFLPMFGVKAFDYGSSAGSLGADVSFKEVGVVRVDSITPGGAADRAGIVVGDEIHTVRVDNIPYQPFAPEVLVRTVRFAGAGKVVTVQVAQPDGFKNIEVTLDAFSGDSWAHMTKYDINQRIFRAGGKPEIADIVGALGQMIRLSKTPAGQIGLESVLFATGAYEWMQQSRQAAAEGRTTKSAVMDEMPRRIMQGMENKMGLPYGSIMNTYEQSRARTGDAWAAMDVAILEVNRLLEPIIKEALRTALHKNDQITMPVAILDESQNFQPRVMPRYINVPATSELARLFIEADYLGKAIIHRPELSERIPAYRTEYAFTGTQPGRVEETTNRLWIEPARVDVRRSSSQNSLGFGAVEMKFNVGRAIGGGAEYRDDAYGRFLSGLYDDLSREFPALHELREAAKLAVVARWLQTRQPGFKLPREGRARLTAPNQMEGFVTLIWSPRSVKVTLIAPGGIDFNVPPIGPSGPVFPDARTVNVPTDTSVVDLSDVVADEMPKVDPAMFASYGGTSSGTALPARYRRPLTQPPVPASVRLVGLATKGQRTMKRIEAIRTQTRMDAGRCDAKQARQLSEKLQQAAGLARQLGGAEKALNAITAQAAERQRTFAEVEQTLREEEQRLRENAVDMATGGLLDAYDELKGSVRVRSIQDLETLISTMRSAKNKLGDFSEKLSTLDLAISSAMARTLSERQKATDNLLGFLKETLAAGADLAGNDAATRALRTAGKTLGAAAKVQEAAEMAASLYKINAAVDRLRQADQMSESELRGLRDSLLPLQRSLSNRVDAVMNDPVVQAYERGEGKFDCGG